jgi:hypothetical protein
MQITMLKKTVKILKMIQSSNEKRTDNDLQNTTQKTKDYATRTPLISGVELNKR